MTPHLQGPSLDDLMNSSKLQASGAWHAVLHKLACRASLATTQAAPRWKLVPITHDNGFAADKLNERSSRGEHQSAKKSYASDVLQERHTQTRTSSYKFAQTGLARNVHF